MVSKKLIPKKNRSFPNGICEFPHCRNPAIKWPWRQSPDHRRSCRVRLCQRHERWSPFLIPPPSKAYRALTANKKASEKVGSDQPETSEMSLLDRLRQEALEPPPEPEPAKLPPVTSGRPVPDYLARALEAAEANPVQLAEDMQIPHNTFCVEHVFIAGYHIHDERHRCKKCRLHVVRYLEQRYDERREGISSIHLQEVEQ